MSTEKTMSTELAVPRRASLPDKIAYARELAESGLLPTQYRKQPANLLYAIEYGEMLGLPPMAAINGIHVIEGKPSASAALISALVRRAGHRLRITGDDRQAVCEIVRADDPDFTFRSAWTIDRAKAAGVAGKAVWRNYPAAMLKARALTECARDACQEALSGVQYTPEELGAHVDEEGAPVRATAERVPAADPGETSEPVSSEPDWDAVLAEVEKTGNITPAWKLARQHRPDDTALRERIQAAGQVRRTKPATPPAEDVVDAEIVEDAPAVPSQGNDSNGRPAQPQAEEKPAERPVNGNGAPSSAAQSALRFVRQSADRKGIPWADVQVEYARRYEGEVIEAATDQIRLTAFAKLLVPAEVSG